MNSKLLFMSIVVLGLIVNISYSDEFAFGDKPKKEESKSKKGEDKAEAQNKKAEAQNKKAEAQNKKAEVETKKNESKGKEVEEFANGVVVESSSTTTICHIPPGNPANNHTITIGQSAWPAHEKHGDKPIPCDDVIWGEPTIDTQVENETTENNSDLAQQISQQIAELQKRLQELFGL